MRKAEENAKEIQLETEDLSVDAGVENIPEVAIEFDSLSEDDEEEEIIGQLNEDVGAVENFAPVQQAEHDVNIRGGRRYNLRPNPPMALQYDRLYTHFLSVL